MGFQVVCLSAVDGSGGEQVGPLLAERLGYRVVNEEIVAMAARQAEVDPTTIADVEKRKSLISRVLERLGPAAASTSMGGYMPLTMDANMPPAMSLGIDLGPGENAMRELIRSAIEQVAEQGRAVIVAHAASFALRERSDTLRVFLTASPETRTARLGEDAKQLTKFDGNRADYLKRFYGVTAEQPFHYDLVVNTDRLEPAVAAEIIARIATG